MPTEAEIPCARWGYINTANYVNQTVMVRLMHTSTKFAQLHTEHPSTHKGDYVIMNKAELTELRDNINKILDALDA